MYSRRDFGKLAFAAVPLSAAFAAEGMRIGATTFSLRDLPHTPGKDAVDDVIKGLQFAGVNEIELNSFDTEAPAPDSRLPPPAGPSAYSGPMKDISPAEAAALKKAIRETFRKWRLFTPAAYYQTIRAKFDAAGISLYAYTMNFDDQFTDPEIDGVFRQAKALGVNAIATTTTVQVARRLVPAAEKYQMTVTVRNLPDVLAMSDRFRVSLDISRHDDPIAFLKQHTERITHVVINDRTRATGTAEKFGDGDAPIKPVLAYLKEMKSPVRAFVEYEYLGLGTPPEELKKCLTYVKAVLG